ncbi:RnfABCDGE type electron transport complex subunit G [Clostridium rectalis]|uniref:RnfABCDGE type electron transport complex subunit G n=1 Tax=Clostridium rectalis TaxID=2040295 RepID=UPI000F64095B|nr:RnfABCDGE type electron transport complex subunit G [Clostridium rectalis]
MLNKGVKGTLVLFLITSICALILSITHSATKDIIVFREKMESLQLDMIFPHRRADNVKELSKGMAEDSIISALYEVYGGKDLIGHAIMVVSKGMGGPMKMTVGVSKEGKISGIKVSSHSETPGIGDIVEKQSFIDRFKNISIKEGLKLVKTSPNNGNEIEAVTGATITSAAVTSGVNEAIKFYKNHVLGEETKKESKEIVPNSLIEGGDAFRDIKVNLKDNIKEVKGICKENKLLGYSIIAYGKGMDEIEVLVTISLKNKITDIKVLKQNETEGLGDAIMEEEFTSKFKNRSIDTPFKVVNRPSKLNSEIEGISGATISSDGVVKGINEAISFYKEILIK